MISSIWCVACRGIEVGVVLKLPHQRLCSTCVESAQGYLAYKKTYPPRTLP